MKNKVKYILCLCLVLACFAIPAAAADPADLIIRAPAIGITGDKTLVLPGETLSLMFTVCDPITRLPISAELSLSVNGQPVSLTTTENLGEYLYTLVIPSDAKNGQTFVLDASTDVFFPYTAAKSTFTITVDGGDNGDYIPDNGGQTTPVSQPVDNFADAKNHERRTAINYVLEKGLMNGVSATSFAPDTGISRAMIVTILHRMEGSPATARSSFDDVPAGMWYTNSIDWAAASGVVEGISETAFAPNQVITVEQLATILYRYAEYKNIDRSYQEVAIDMYDDADQISEYAKDAMGWAVYNGYITPRETATYNLEPQSQVTRAEAATSLMYFLQSTGN